MGFGVRPNQWVVSILITSSEIGYFYGFILLYILKLLLSCVLLFLLFWNDPRSFSPFLG